MNLGQCLAAVAVTSQRRPENSLKLFLNAFRRQKCTFKFSFDERSMAGMLREARIGGTDTS